ncbi:MAG: FeoA family protein [Fuerstiella sp.]
MSRLSDLTQPGFFRVQHLDEQGEETIRLKRLGICEKRVLELLHAGDPMIVRVVGCRIGISRRLAQSVSVLPVCAEDRVLAAAPV